MVPSSRVLRGPGPPLLALICDDVTRLAVVGLTRTPPNVQVSTISVF